MNKKNKLAPAAQKLPTFLSRGIHFLSQNIFISMLILPVPVYHEHGIERGGGNSKCRVSKLFLHAIIVLTSLTDGAAPWSRRRERKCRELEEKRPIYRWPGWECIGRSTRTLLPCPVGFGPLTVTGLIAAKSWNLDHSSTTEAGERVRETDKKCGITAHAYRKC